MEKELTALFDELTPLAHTTGRYAYPVKETNQIIRKHFENMIPAEIIKEFVEQVERKAEEKMLKTGKLEGAHYAAMKELIADL